MVFTIQFRAKAVLFFLLLSVFSSTTLAKVVVLVPGFFNSLAPGHVDAQGIKPYWSATIVNTFKKAGYKVFVVKGLNPVGSIEENGQRLLHFLDSIKSDLQGEISFSVVAHSAGGLYTLYANHLRPLPIKRLVAINTPFDGVEFIERITRDVPGVTDLEAALNLESLNQLRPELVHRALGQLRSPPQFPVDAIYGFQPQSYWIWDAAYLSPIFYLTQALMERSSDGIVTHHSALSGDGLLRVGRPDEIIYLDHWKQVLDADLFRFFGMINVEYIRQEQIRFYSQLLEILD